MNVEEEECEGELQSCLNPEIAQHLYLTSQMLIQTSLPI